MKEILRYDQKTLNETLNLPTQNGHTLRYLTFLNNDSDSDNGKKDAKKMN